MLVLLIISFFILSIGFIIVTFKQKSIPESISSIVYYLSPNMKWLWIVWVWIIAFSVGIPLIDTLSDNYKIFGFLTMFSLVFCGSMPITKNEKNTMHYIFAILSGIFSQICVYILDNNLLYVWLSLFPCFIFTIFYTYIKLKDTDILIVLDKVYMIVIEAICALTLYVSIYKNLKYLV